MTGLQDPPPVDRLVVLVGGNPLANFHAVTTLRLRELVLCTTPEMEAIAAGLARVVGRIADAPDVLPSLMVDDAWSAQAVSAAFDVMDRGWTLNYTGGTKVMSVHAVAVHRAQGHGPGQACYTHEGRGQLVFDDGRRVTMRTAATRAAEVALLHGYELRRDRHDPVESVDVAAEVVRRTLAVAADRRRAGRSLTARDKLVARAPLEDRAAADPAWRALAGGGQWLEPWVGAQLRSVHPAGRRATTTEVLVAQCAVRDGRRFEVDVVAVVGHRLHVASCTTVSTSAQVKHKAFEVASRARQLGGDLARSAVVCLASPAQAQLVRQDLAAAWPFPAVPAIFGQQELAAWLAGDHASLLAWLA